MTISLKINGIERSGIMDDRTWSVDDRLNSRKQGSFRLIDRTFGLSIRVGQTLELSRFGFTLFKGTIEDLSEQIPEEADGFKTIDVRAVDFTELADRHTVVNRYEAGLLAGNVVKDIVNSASLLGAEGVTVAGVQDGFELDELAFDSTVAEALDDLAEAVGFTWYIDFNKDLQFFPREFFQAPNNFGDSDRRYTRTSYRRTREDYFNSILFRGGNAETQNLPAERFRGDGETRQWDLKFPAAKPESQPNGIHPTIKVNTVEQTVGISGEDEDVAGSKAFFWKPENTSISQNFNQTVLSSTDTLEVTYTGLFEIRLTEENADEIAARAAIQGGTGIYVGIIDEESIDGLQFALQRADTVLSRHDQIQEEFRIETNIDLLYRAGQLMELSFARYGVTGSWLIERMRVRPLSSDRIVQSLTLINSDLVARDFAFWKALEEAGRLFHINERQRLIVAKKGRDRLGFTGAVLAELGNQLIPKQQDIYSFFRAGFWLAGRWRMGREVNP